MVLDAAGVAATLDRMAREPEKESKAIIPSPAPFVAVALSAAALLPQSHHPSPAPGIIPYGRPRFDFSGPHSNEALVRLLNLRERLRNQPTFLKSRKLGTTQFRRGHNQQLPGVPQRVYEPQGRPQKSQNRPGWPAGIAGMRLAMKNARFDVASQTSFRAL